MSERDYYRSKGALPFLGGEGDQNSQNRPIGAGSPNQGVILNKHCIGLASKQSYLRQFYGFRNSFRLSENG